MRFWSVTANMDEVATVVGKGRIDISGEMNRPTPTCEFAFLENRGAYIVVWWRDDGPRPNLDEFLEDG